MHVLAAIRLTGHLNALAAGGLPGAPAGPPMSPEVAARHVIADDTAHHVIDSHGVLGLDPLRANDLDRALSAVALLTSTTPTDPGWALVLPEPGALGVLRGPAELTAAALEAEVAVVHTGGGHAFVPQQVGSAIQWQVLPANPPAPTVTPPEAERQLSEAVLAAGRRLGDLDMTAGERPAEVSAMLPAAYGSRAQRGAQRALTILRACDAGLADSNLLHSHAVTTRETVLRTLRRTSADALCAWTTWL